MTTSSRMARRRAQTERTIGRLRAGAVATVALALFLALALLLPDTTRVPPPANRRPTPPSAAHPATPATGPGREPTPETRTQEPPGASVPATPGPSSPTTREDGSDRQRPPGGQGNPTPAPDATELEPPAGPDPGSGTGPPATDDQDTTLVDLDLCVEGLLCMEGGLL